METVVTTPIVPSRRSILGTLALVSTVISAVGLVVSIFDGAVHSEESGTVAAIFVYVGGWGWVAAALFGVAAWVKGSRTDNRFNTRAGRLAVAYAVLSWLFIVIADWPES
jgi:hypothetical protein